MLTLGIVLALLAFVINWKAAMVMWLAAFFIMHSRED